MSSIFRFMTMFAILLVAWCHFSPTYANQGQSCHQVILKPLKLQFLKLTKDINLKIPQSNLLIGMALLELAISEPRTLEALDFRLDSPELLEMQERMERAHAAYGVQVEVAPKRLTELVVGYQEATVMMFKELGLALAPDLLNWSNFGKVYDRDRAYRQFFKGEILRVIEFFEKSQDPRLLNLKKIMNASFASVEFQQYSLGIREGIRKMVAAGEKFSPFERYEADSKDKNFLIQLFFKKADEILDPEESRVVKPLFEKLVKDLYKDFYGEIIP